MSEPVKLLVSKNFFHAFRQALLMIVDAIERELNISPTTAEIREQFKMSRSKTA